MSFEGSEDNQGFASKWRQNRACARCRRLKMKCAFDGPTFKSCKRCFSIGVDCSFDSDPTAQFAKKRSRRSTFRIDDEPAHSINTESVGSTRNGDQISQLYNLVKLVSTSVNSLEHDVSVTSAVNVTDAKRLNDVKDNLNLAISKISNILGGNSHNLKQFQDYHKSPSMKHYPYIAFNSNIAQEIVETHKLVSLEEFKSRHKFFLNEMLPYYPVISLSQNLSNFDWLYQNQPLLLTGCVYVTTINDNGHFSALKERYMSNEALNKMLNYYLESSISYHVYIKADEFSYQLVELCLILSLWCLPTTTSGHFKNQLNLLIGFNISLCIDLGEVTRSAVKPVAVLPDNSEQRNHLRSFLSVYVSCGSLGLSLPRFKLVSWTRQHENAIEVLSRQGTVEGVQLPSRHDVYLTVFAKIIRLGQELFEFFSPKLLLDTNPSLKRKDTVFNNMLDPFNNSAPHIKFILDSYEQKLHSLLLDSGFVTTPDPNGSEPQPKEKYLLSIIYYQLLMIAYDNIVSRYFVLESKNEFNDAELLTYVQYVVKLIRLCESLLESFIELGRNYTINLPTFFFYRPMHALILLVKLRILIRSSSLSRQSSYVNPDDLHIDAEKYFNESYKIIQESQQKYSSIVCSRMAIILDRIEKWMVLSNGKKENNSSGNNTSNSTRSEHGSALVNLIDTSKEIENLRAPKEDVLESQVSSAPATESQASNSPVQNQNGPASISDLYANSIRDIFNVMDSDILNLINPLDPNIDFDSNSLDLSHLHNNFNDSNDFNLY